MSQHAKFRWTEKLTCRFIQLRREHAKMFTGRKYSAQQGWEYILRQMRQEFPAIMAEVHYRVLKKKWSNLLQQYKELKNPVHGDKNRADDISWPFYAAIDEVIASLSSLSSNNSRRRRGASCINDEQQQQQQHDNNNHIQKESHEEEEEEDEDEEDDLNPQEFLCVSVSPDDVDETTPIDYERLPALQPPSLDDQRPNVFDLDCTHTRHSRRSSELLSRLPRATELTIRAVKRDNLEISRASDYEQEEENARPRKSCKRQQQQQQQHEEKGLERRIVEFMEYTKKRDEENRSILMRMLEALQDIRNALR